MQHEKKKKRFVCMREQQILRDCSMLQTIFLVHIIMSWERKNNIQSGFKYLGDGKITSAVTD